LPPAADALSLSIEHGHRLGATIRNEHTAGGGEEQAVRSPGLLPLVQILPILIEDLDAVVLAVANIDPTAGVEHDGMGKIELACAGSLFAPGLEVLAFPGELHDARVAVAIRDVDLAGRAHGHVGRLVELVRAGAGFILLAQREKNLALRVELDH